MTAHYSRNKTLPGGSCEIRHLQGGRGGFRGSPYRLLILHILLLASVNIFYRTIYFYLCKDKLMKLIEKNPGRVLWRQAQTLQTVYETFRRQ